MAHFRKNHDPQSGAGPMIARITALALLLAGLFFVFSFFLGTELFRPGGAGRAATWDGSDAFYLPVSPGQGPIIQHRYYTLAYNEEHEQAEWVAYILTREELEQPWQKRPDRFEEDPAVATGSATWYDYRGSGYDRGHLVPAADRAFSRQAIEETFLMSNISPQEHHFNAGIWRELEELARNWAKRNGKLYVVSGPVLNRRDKGRIGDNGVTVPAAFYKVLLDLSEPELKGIAFLLPNEISYAPLADYAVSIDSAESYTGIDFFPELMTPELEAELEEAFDLPRWPFSPEKYQRRINQWNLQ